MTIAVTGLRQVRERLLGLEERARDFTPALEIVAELLERAAVRQFETQGQWAGTPWAPLAASTVRARERRWGYYRQPPNGVAGGAFPVLLWTSRLLGGFQRESGEHIRQITADALRWGNAVPYAKYLQPRRPMIAFRNSFATRMVVLEPLRLWMQGVPAGAIRTVALARTGLG